MMHAMYLGEVKKPEDSESDWDMVRILREIPAEEACMPLEKSTCAHMK